MGRLVQRLTAPVQHRGITLYPFPEPDALLEASTQDPGAPSGAMANHSVPVRRRECRPARVFNELGDMRGMLYLRFERLGVVLSPTDVQNAADGLVNPASARLRDGTLQLYPRLVARGNVSRIGSFSITEEMDGSVSLDEGACALEPRVPYEIRTGPQGYGCEDPRVTYIGVLDQYVMAYVAFGPRGPEIALAISNDGLQWERLGLLCFKQSAAPFADKDAAFFPEPVLSPSGVISLALYHRPTLRVSAHAWQNALSALKALPPEAREAISIGYIPLDAVRENIRRLCDVEETHRLRLPSARWGLIKAGAGTPPMRIAEGWLSLFHGVDEIAASTSVLSMQYCCGIVIHDALQLDQVIYRSP